MGSEPRNLKLKTIKCEDCGTIILIWPKQDRLCHNCKQNRLKAANKKSQEIMQNAKKAVSATGDAGGLEKWT